MFALGCLYCGAVGVPHILSRPVPSQVGVSDAAAHPVVSLPVLHSVLGCATLCPDDLSHANLIESRVARETSLWPELTCP